MSPRSLLRSTGLALCAATLASLAVPDEQAHACGVIACFPGEALPSAGTLPANVEVLWKPTHRGNGQPVSETPHLYMVDAAGRVELPVTSTLVAGLLHIVPKSPLVVGSDLALELDPPPCGFASAQPAMRVRVTPAAELPSQLGTLKAALQVTNPRPDPGQYIGACGGAPPRVFRALKLTLAAQASSYVDALRHALIVDGVEQSQYREVPPIGVRPSLGGPLEDKLIARCDGPANYYSYHTVEPGTHRVQWLSRLADGTELRSDEIEVELQCAAEQGAADAGPVDASVGLADANVTPSARDLADATAGAAEHSREGGSVGEASATNSGAAPSASDADAESDGGCSVTPSQPWQGALGWALTLLVAWVARVRLLQRRMPRGGRAG